MGVLVLHLCSYGVHKVDSPKLAHFCRDFGFSEGWCSHIELLGLDGNRDFTRLLLCTKTGKAYVM
jgi:hypothetical protein